MATETAFSGKKRSGHARDYPWIPQDCGCLHAKNQTSVNLCLGTASQNTLVRKTSKFGFQINPTDCELRTKETGVSADQYSDARDSLKIELVTFAI